MMLRIVAILALLGVGPVLGGKVPITSCGQTVGKGQTGILMNDLACGDQWGLCRSCATCFPVMDPPIPCSSPADCPDPAVNDCYANDLTSIGVRVVPRGRLLLNGHSISAVSVGVEGILPDGTAPRGTVTLTGPGTISGTAIGIHGVDLKVTGVTFRDNLIGVQAGRKATVKDVDASSNSTGVNVQEVLRATGLVADDNRYVGVFSYEGARLVRSHATGNAEADIASEYAPKLILTVCDHSAGLRVIDPHGIFDAKGPPWGVCSGD